MHYYQFNIGDYSSHTSRLSLIEDLAYRRLLDLYYLNERPFNACSTTVARDIGLLDHLQEVEYILTKFFVEEDGYLVNKRADTEIKAYQDKQKSASKAGKASAKARQNKASEQAFNDRSTTVQPNIKHKPLNIKHKPTKEIGKIKRRFIPPSLEEVQFHINEKGYIFDAEVFVAHYTSNDWKVGKNKMKCWKSACTTWGKREAKSNGQQKQYLTAAEKTAQRLRDSRDPVKAMDF